jgi:quercetin dioxygenase-like cupin family protein
MPGRVRTEVHLGAQQTGGAFCMLVDEPPPGWSLPPHRHLNEAETIHVLDGQFELEIEGERVKLGPGETIYVPSGAIHSGANVGERVGRRVVIFSPAGLERFFLEAGTAGPGETDLKEVLTSALRHGWEFVAP